MSGGHARRTRSGSMLAERSGATAQSVVRPEATVEEPRASMAERVL